MNPIFIGQYKDHTAIVKKWKVRTFSGWKYYETIHFKNSRFEDMGIPFQHPTKSEINSARKLIGITY